MKKNYLLLSVVFTGVQLMAQTLVKQKEITIIAGPSICRLVNTNIDKDDHKVVDKQAGFNFSFSYNRYFKNRIGIGIGLGFSDYKQTVYQKGLFIKPNQTDKDGDMYDLWMKSDMTYTANLMYADVPITLHLLLGSSPKFYGFLDAALINGFLINGKYTEKGSVENMGAYPTSTSSPNPFFYIVSHNNPYYGHSVSPYDKTYTDSYKFYNASLRVSVGIAAAMTDRLFLRVAPVITKGFSDVTIKDDKGKDYLNVFGDKSAYKATKIFSLGINIGFAFNLGS